MPTVIMRKYDNPDGGYPSKIFEVVAIAPDGFDVQRHIDQLNRQQALLEASIREFKKIITGVVYEFPPPVANKLKIQKRKSHTDKLFISPETQHEKDEIYKLNESISKENRRRHHEWRDKCIAKCVESASSIKNLPDALIAEFQKTNQIPFEYDQNYVYFSREVPYAA